MAIGLYLSLPSNLASAPNCFGPCNKVVAAQDKVVSVAFVG